MINQTCNLQRSPVVVHLLLGTLITNTYCIVLHLHLYFEKNVVPLFSDVYLLIVCYRWIPHILSVLLCSNT